MLETVGDIDRAVIAALNAYARQTPAFDQAVSWLSFHHLLRGGVLIALLWAAWLRQGFVFDLRESRVLETILAVVTAITISRAAQLALPYRPRPLHDAAIDFIPPIGVVPETLLGWSAFPSDHAVLFFTLATATFCLHRKLGAVALVWALLAASLPRLYIGAHYPSDILAGIVLGVGITLLCFSPAVSRLLRPVSRRLEAHPRAITACLILATFETSQLFSNVRSLAWTLSGLEF